MKNSLKPGLTFEFQYKIPEDKTVPYLFPDILLCGREVPGTVFKFRTGDGRVHHLPSGAKRTYCGGDKTQGCSLYQG